MSFEDNGGGGAPPDSGADTGAGAGPITPAPATQESPPPRMGEGIDAAVDKAFEQAFGRDADAGDDAPQQPPSGETNAAGRIFDPTTGRFLPTKQADGSGTAGQQPEGKEPTGDVPTPPGGPSGPPARFNAEAKAEWEKLPPVVQGEVQRLERELTQGLEQYRAAAELWEPIQEYHELAQKYNTTVPDALAGYVMLDHIWHQDPVAGFFQTCDKVGVDPREVLAAVMGPAYQAPQHTDQQGQPQPGGDPVLLAQVQQLQQQLQRQAEYIQQLGGHMQQQTEQQQQQQLYNSIEAERTALVEFAKTHPALAELEPTMVRMVETGFVDGNDLEATYDAAMRHRPDIAAKYQGQQTQAATRRPASEAKAQLSITGAPSGGSNPPATVPGSAAEAVDRAFDEVGL